MERVGAIGRFWVLAFFGSILCLILIVIKVNFVTYKVHRDSIDLGLECLHTDLRRHPLKE